MMFLALVATVVAPVASAHWGFGIPAHHVVAAPTGAGAFDLPGLLCRRPGAMLDTHAAYNAAELRWHAAAEAVGSPYPTLPEVFPPQLEAHTHHVGADGSPDASGFVIPDHLAIEGLFGEILAPAVINPVSKAAGDVLGLGGDVDPGHPPPCDAAHASQFPQNPTVSGVVVAFDSSLAPTFPSGLAIHGCVDRGDNDYETGLGGASFLIDALPTVAGELWTGAANLLLGLLSSGPIDIGACAVPFDFVSQAGSLPRVAIGGLPTTPPGAPFRVCYDGDNNGVCMFNLYASRDAWDECTTVQPQFTSTFTIANPTYGSQPGTGPAYAVVFPGLTLYGLSMDSGFCTPKKGGPLGTISGAGPGFGAVSAPGVATIRVVTGDPTIDFTYLFVFTSVCAELSETTNECGGAGEPSGLPVAGWVIAG